MAPTHAARRAGAASSKSLLRNIEDADVDAKKEDGGTSGAAATQEERAQRIQDAFKLFDTDHDGLLSAEEVMAILTRQGGKKRGGHPLARENAKQLIKWFDQNNDGKLSLAEFTLFLMNTRPLAEALGVAAK